MMHLGDPGCPVRLINESSRLVSESMSEETEERLPRRFDRFAQEGVPYDIVLHVGEEEIPAHRRILADNSEFFSVMFASGLKDANERHVALLVEYDVVMLAIEYVYTQKVTLDDDNIYDAIAAASFFCIEGMQRACENFLNEHLDVINCIETFILADQFDLRCALKRATEFIEYHFFQVTRRKDFLSLSAKQFEQFLSSPSLRADDETRIFQAIKEWVKHDEEARRDELSRLVGTLRMSRGALTKALEECNLSCTLEVKENVQPRMYGERVEVLVKLLDSNIDICDPNSHNRPIWFRPRNDIRLDSTFQILGCDIYQIQESITRPSFFASMSFDVLKEGGKLSWTKKADLHVSRIGGCLVEGDGMLYYLGGYVPELGHKRLNVVECYDPSMDAWSRKSGMTIARSHLAGICVGGYIYAIGGNVSGGMSSVGDKCSFGRTSYVEKYDPKRDVWSFVASLNDPRRKCDCWYLKDKIFVIGGGCSKYGVSCEVYYEKTNEWQLIPPLPEFRQLNPTTFALDNRLLMLGEGTLYEYAEERNGWQWLNDKKLRKTLRWYKLGAKTMTISRMLLERIHRLEDLSMTVTLIDPIPYKRIEHFEHIEKYCEHQYN